MIVTRHKYDNAYSHDNVYGHALSLLRKHGGKDGLHLDLGCGYGRIAEPIQGELGLEYIGLDFCDQILQSLRERGFQTQAIDLLNPDGLREAITSVVGSKRIASMTILDVLEHIEDPAPILRVLREFCHIHAAPLIISVPNVTHRDIGLKLLMGHWDYTPAGLLDDDHIRFYTDSHLTRVTQACGWCEVARNDTSNPSSEQAFPTTLPTIAAATPLRDLLVTLRSNADAFGETFQLIRAYLPGPADTHEFTSFSVPVVEAKPFLSVIVRTQGRRPDTLRDALLCLTGQSCTDFEVIVIAHKINLEEQLIIERIIEDVPEWLRSRIRLEKLYSGNRSAPLNFGFSLAEGRYIAILDDDDLPFGNWVETFKTLADQYPGRILRTIAVRQNSKCLTTISGKRAPKFTSSPVPYPSTFNWITHLNYNESPPISLAFPRGGFHHLGLRFDEALDTTEDWDFLMRTFLVCGVSSEPKVTAIYRLWENDESSRTIHSKEEWDRNRERILHKLDGLPCVLQAGSLGDIRRIYRLASGAAGAASAHAAVCNTTFEEARELSRRLRKLLRSSSWKVTSPLRAALQVFGRDKKKYNWREDDPARLRAQIEELTNSLSWKITSPIRRMTGGRKYDPIGKLH
jgi:hypothetical protein